MNGHRVVVVEDDRTIGNGLARALEAQGYEPVWARDGAAGLAALAGASVDLVVLDLGLPDLDGVELCRRIRTDHPEVVILILTARSEEIDVVVGLDAGADDYVAKPFRLAELLARIRAHLRTREVTPGSGLLEAGDLVVDTGARRARLGGEDLELRAKEFDLLALLVAERGKTVRRERIMSEVWDEHWFGPTKTLDMHISALRKKIGSLPDGRDRITTLRGVGYRLELE